MNEVETKIGEAIREIERLIRPMVATQDDMHATNAALDTLKLQLIMAIGRRVIKGNK